MRGISPQINQQETRSVMRGLPDPPEQLLVLLGNERVHDICNKKGIVTPGKGILEEVSLDNAEPVLKSSPADLSPRNRRLRQLIQRAFDIGVPLRNGSEKRAGAASQVQDAAVAAVIPLRLGAPP